MCVLWGNSLAEQPGTTVLEACRFGVPASKLQEAIKAEAAEVQKKRYTPIKVRRAGAIRIHSAVCLPIMR